MIYSMTGFAESEVQTPFGTLNFEIKSLNHRYFEINFKLPEWFREMELELRELARRRLNRGKVDCSLRLSESIDEVNSLNVDFTLVEQLIKQCQKINTLLPNASTLSALDILKWPNVIKPVTLDKILVQKEVMIGFNQALDNLMASRAEEGKNLKAIILERLQKMALIIKKIKARQPKISDLQREKLLIKINTLKSEVDENRLEQELVYLASKMDIEEELDRFSTHLKSTMDIIESQTAIGRHLDFIMQELNREANTIASKSVDAEITEESIELKVLIEQVREQIQNLV